MSKIRLRQEGGADRAWQRAPCPALELEPEPPRARQRRAETMVQFPEPPKEDYASVYIEDTDRPLPGRVDTRLRYAYIKTVARGCKSIIQVCKDLQLSRTICYMSLRE